MLKSTQHSRSTDIRPIELYDIAIISNGAKKIRYAYTSNEDLYFLFNVKYTHKHVASHNTQQHYLSIKRMPSFDTPKSFVNAKKGNITTPKFCDRCHSS